MPTLRWIDVVVATRRFLVRHPAVRWIVVGLLAVVAYRSVAGIRAEAETVQRRWSTSQLVLVATTAIDVGASLDSSVTEFRRLPEAAVPPTALVNRPAGLVAIDPIAPGEIVVAGHVSTGATEGGLATGTVGVPLPRPAGWTPTVGDLVAVVTIGDPTGLTTDGPGPGPTTVDGEIVSVDDEAILVAVSELDAPTVAAAGASGGAVVVLRPG